MTEQNKTTANKKRLSVPIVLLGVVACVAILFVFEQAYPRNAASAKERLEREGYTQVDVFVTRRSCGKNRKLFTFTGTNRDGVITSGRLCFDLFRFASSITED